MKINERLEKAINNQIHQQWILFYDLLAMSAWLETTPFKGFSKWMLTRSEKEQQHAIQLFEFLRNRFGTLETYPIDEPVKRFESPLDVFEKALEKKRAIIAKVYALYASALEEKDLETQQLLHGFLHEQVHEEKDMQDVKDKLELAKQNADALIHLDYKEEVIYASSHS